MGPHAPALYLLALPGLGGMEQFRVLERMKGVPADRFRRPAFLALLVLAGVCLLRKERGDFRLETPREQERRLAQRLLVVEGLVVSPLREDTRGRKVVLEAFAAGGRAWRGRVQARLPPAAAPRPGMTLRLRGVLRRPFAAKNPGDFDERAFLELKRIGWILTVEDWQVLAARVPWKYKLSFAAEGARQALAARLTRLLPRNEARLVAGVLFGLPGPLDPDFARAVRDAAAVHLLVPSGTQVAFALLGAAWAGRLLGLWPSARFALAAASGTFYAIMTGAEPPQLRALAGGLAFYASLLCGREAGAFQALVLSALVLLVDEPRELFSAGFQMTYLASAALMAVLPRVEAAARGRPAWLAALAQTAVATAAVQAVLLPLSASLFGRAALLGAAANLVLVPLSGVLMAAGAALLLVPWLSPVVAALAGLFREICLLAASLPWAAVEVPAMRVTAVAAYYLALVPLIAGFRRRAAVFCVAAALCLWASGAAAEKLAAAPLRVVYLWPAEARTALVSFDGERHWLVNAGVPAKTIVKAMREYRIRRFERLIITQESCVKGTAVRQLMQWGYLRPEAVEVPAFGRKMAAICLQRVCASFDPPRLERGQAQFSIIPASLKFAAVEAATNGIYVDIRGAAGQEIH